MSGAVACVGLTVTGLVLAVTVVTLECAAVCCSLCRPRCHRPRPCCYCRHVYRLPDAQEGRRKLRSWWAEDVADHRLHEDAWSRIFCIDVSFLYLVPTAAMTISYSSWSNTAYVVALENVHFLVTMTGNCPGITRTHSVIHSTLSYCVFWRIFPSWYLWNTFLDKSIPYILCTLEFKCKTASR